jgi:hypothetical protein
MMLFLRARLAGMVCWGASVGGAAGCGETFAVVTFGGGGEADISAFGNVTAGFPGGAARDGARDREVRRLAGDTRSTEIARSFRGPESSCGGAKISSPQAPK